MTIIVNRRERVRAATVQEIKDVARRQLVTEGPAAVSLRAIAREMGMTAPALYRYFPSFDHLVQALVTDMYAEACTALQQARIAAQGLEPGQRIVAVARSLRTWAVNHPAEFGLIFGNPLPSTPPVDAHSATVDGATQLAGVFLTTVEEAHRNSALPSPAPDDLVSGLVDQLAGWREKVSTTLPIGALAVAVECWMQLLGAVSLEVFNHLRFACKDGSCSGEPFFEHTLQTVLRRLEV